MASILQQFFRQRLISMVADFLADYVRRLSSEQLSGIITGDFIPDLSPVIPEQYRPLVRTGLEYLGEPELEQVLNHLMLRVPLEHAVILSRHRQEVLGRLKEIRSRLAELTL